MLLLLCQLSTAQVTTEETIHFFIKDSVHASHLFNFSKKMIRFGELKINNQSQTD